MNLIVRKITVLNTLYKNLQEHQEDYAEAKANYLTKVAEFLNDEIEKSKDFEYCKNHVFIHKPKPPVDYSKEYTDAINILKSYDGDEVTLSSVEYRKFILDEWDWTTDWISTNSLYSTGKSATLSKSND